ncbi:MAG: hypothetical protein AB7W16_15060 [Candidatus Obscuribacterales bacterium]
MNDFVAAILNDDEAAVRSMVQQSPSVLVERSESNRSPLDLALHGGKFRAALALYLAGADSECFENAPALILHGLMAELFENLGDDEFGLWDCVVRKQTRFRDIDTDVFAFEVEFLERLEELARRSNIWMTATGEVIPLSIWAEKFEEWKLQQYE